MMQRYLVLTELFLPTKGGTAVWFDEVYRRMGGKEIHIVTAAVPDAEAHDVAHPNSIHRLHLRRVAWLRPESLGMYASLMMRSLALAIRHRFSAIHAGRALPEGLVAWLVARLAGLPVVIYAHGEELTGWGAATKYRAMRFALRHADRIIANSEFTRQALLKMGVREERISTIFPGVDVSRFRPGLPTVDLRNRLGLANGTALLLSVGRLQRRKGFDMAIRCLPDLVAKGLDVHYAIIGIGDDREYLKALAAELMVEERVHFLGHVPMDELPRWYNACDLFVLANRDVGGDTEGFGMVFIEAAACGKATIAGLAGGTGSAVLDGVTGLRVDGESLPALVGAIADILVDVKRREALGAAGQARARELLSWDAVAARTVALGQNEC
jgi:phosphatidyl-myo-inositol dimannoside synthase